MARTLTCEGEVSRSRGLTYLTRRVRSVTEICRRERGRKTCSGTVAASPSAAYGIAHDTEAAGSLALEANLSRGFAGSRVKFLRMHRRLPSLLIPRSRALRPPVVLRLIPRSGMRSPSSLSLHHARPFIPRISVRAVSHRSSPLRRRAPRVASSSYASFPSSGSLLNHEATSVWRRDTALVRELKKYFMK